MSKKKKVTFGICALVAIILGIIVGYHEQDNETTEVQAPAATAPAQAPAGDEVKE